MRTLSTIETIVDTDVHITDRQELFLPYIEDPFASMLSTGDSWRTVGYPNASYVTPGTTGKAKEELEADLSTPSQIDDVMDMLETDRIVMTPNINLSLAMLHHDELAAAIATAYNSWILDELADGDAGRYAAGIVAPQKPERGAEEIDRLRNESDIVGIMIPSAGALPPLGREWYFSIYDAAERAGLPIMTHNANTGLMGNFPHQWRWTKRYIDAHVTYHPAEHMFNLSTLLTNGVPVRYPDLTFVFQEAGLGWIPYFMRRYDKEYSEKREDAPMLEKPPSDYLKDRFYFTSQPIEGADDPEYLKHIVRLFGGEDRLMFSSDYPHFDFDHTDELLTLLRPHFSDDELDAIYGKTALEVFDFS